VKGMTIIVQTISKLVMTFIIIFGIYIVAYGHLTPGGGFAGGTIIACAFVLMTIAFGGEAALKKMSQQAAGVLDSAGALAFLLIAWLGVFGPGRTFFWNLFGDHKGQPFNLFSAGSIPLNNVAIGLKVGACVFGVFIALVLFHRRSDSS